MKKPHKHAELIKAWADGAEIEYRNKHSQDSWETMHQDCWGLDWLEFRAKPKPKPDMVVYGRATWVYLDMGPRIQGLGTAQGNLDNIKLTFECETGQLKSVEML